LNARATREWVFVALGSNLGDREGYLTLARERLGLLPHTELRAVSAIEETDPIGPPAQGCYLNQMVLLATMLPPEALLDHLQAIERDAGRERGVRWGPRTLDLDIVRYGQVVSHHPRVILPHPELPNRPFWQRGIAELERHVTATA